MSDSKDANRVIIFDTTLRDGEQSPGASMNLDEKLRIAQVLEEMGVDVIEAGFPIASDGDFEAVHEIAKIIGASVVCGLARATRMDIERCAEAVRPARRGRIHTFIATSPLHMKYKLQMEPDAVHEQVIESVSYARRFTDDVEWSCEDGSRSEHDFLCRCVESAIDAGATTINVPDTVGYAMPNEFTALIEMLFERVPNIDKAVLSVHCHNDLGLAVANSLAAVEHGAGQIECTINGIGERAGNCALEEVVMTLRTRADYYGCRTGVHTKRLVPISRLVAGITGIQVQRNKAIVGRNAFAHEAGIHQDGMLKEPTTYEIMRPEDVGFAKTDLVLGKHSGRAALADRAKALGYQLTGEQLQSVFADFKLLADRKKEIYDGDITALIENQLRGVLDEEWTLVSFRVTSATGTTPQVQLTLRHGDQEFSEEISDGDGPIDAAFLATEKITGVKLVCKDYQVRSATLGHDALGEVTLEVEHNGKTHRARGVSTDTVEATVLAILNAVNRIVMAQGGEESPVEP